MYFTVEPRDGQELDRLITAMLNLTGTVRRVVEADDDECAGDLDGEQVIGVCAERLRGMLTFVAEHHSDEELALVTQVQERARS
ncbi:MAG: hypothetical protein WD844_02655 [Thermoleophilaceae bacterium]